MNDRCEVCQKKHYNLIHNASWSGRKGHQFVPHFKHHFKLIEVQRGVFALTTYVFQCTTCFDKHITPKWSFFKRPRGATIKNLWNHDFERAFSSFDDLLAEWDPKP